MHWYIGRVLSHYTPYLNQMSARRWTVQPDREKEICSFKRMAWNPWGRWQKWQQGDRCFCFKQGNGQLAHHVLSYHPWLHIYVLVVMIMILSSDQSMFGKCLEDCRSLDLLIAEQMNTHLEQSECNKADILVSTTAAHATNQESDLGSSSLVIGDNSSTSHVCMYTICDKDDKECFLPKGKVA